MNDRQPAAWPYSTAIGYFLVVAEKSSLSAASEQLHVAVSAISRKVQQLESQLGTPLFQRHARGMLLTAAGKVLQQRLLEQQQHMLGALAQIRGLTDVNQTQIRVACTQGVAFELLPELMARFGQRHSGVHFQVEIYPTQEISQCLRRQSCDLAIQFSLGSQPDASVVRAYQAPVLLLLRQDHPLAGTRVGLTDLEHWPIALPHPGSSVRQLFDLSCRVHNLFIQPALVGDSFATQYNSVRHSQALLGLCSKPSVMHRVQADGLLLKELQGLQSENRILQIRLPEGRSQAPLVQEFVDLADAEIRQLANE